MKIRYKLLTTIFAFTGMALIISAQVFSKNKALGLELGAKLPELKVTNQYGKEIPLTAAKDDRWVFVFFYPKALTGG
jgi:cytochrome oxidase Cu insertion factor (SCO1/SenC/PrrC family)